MPPSPTWSPTRSPTPATDSTVLVSTKTDEEHGRDLGRRPGHRHPQRRARPHLRAFLPRRPGAPPIHRRHRPRAVHRQARRGDPRRRDPRVVRRGPGLHVHPHPAARPRTSETSDVEHDPGSRRRGRGELLRCPRLHAPQGGVRRRDRRDRPRRPGGVRPPRRRHRAARPDAPGPARHRGVPPDPPDLQRPGHHGQRQGRRGRQGGRPRAGRRRLRHQALLPPRAGRPHPRGAAPRPGARPRAVRPSRPGRCGWTSSGTW